MCCVVCIVCGGRASAGPLLVPERGVGGVLFMLMPRVGVGSASVGAASGTGRRRSVAAACIAGRPSAAAVPG